MSASDFIATLSFNAARVGKIAARYILITHTPRCLHAHTQIAQSARVPAAAVAATAVAADVAAAARRNERQLAGTRDKLVAAIKSNKFAIHFVRPRVRVRVTVCVCACE